MKIALIEIESLECFFSRGFTAKDVRKIREFMKDHKVKLMEVWNEYHS